MSNDEPRDGPGRNETDSARVAEGVEGGTTARGGGTRSMRTARPRSRTLFVGGGLLVALLGLLAVLSPFVTGLAITLVLGVVLVVGAIGHLVAAFSGRGWTGFVFQVVLAILYALAGISLLSEPIVGLVTLTLLLAAYLLVEGAVEVVLGLRVRPADGWGWIVGSGFLSLLLSVLLFVGFPSTAAWALGLLVGLSLLSTGASMVLLGMAGEPAADRPAGRPAGGGETKPD